MIHSVSSVNNSKCSFGGINVGKGINAGVECAQKFAKTAKLETDTFEKLPNKVVKNVLGSPHQIEEANKIVTQHATIAGSIAYSAAQIPGGDIIPLEANEAAMATRICNNIYGMNLSKTFIHSMFASWTGTKVGTQACKIFFGFFPGAGNFANASIATATTLAVGKGVIMACEEYQKKKCSLDEFKKLIDKYKKGE